MTDIAATLGGGAMPTADPAVSEPTAPAETPPANGAGSVTNVVDGVKAAAAAVDANGKAVAVAVVAPDRSAVIARVDALAAQIHSAPKGGSKAYQVELAQVAAFLPRLRAMGNEDLIDQAELALDALRSDPPSMVLARKTNRALRWALWARSYNPATRMMVGVAILSYFFAFGWLLMGGKILGLDVQSLLGPAVFGWLGSVASMVTRINSFRTVENPITVGATRPLLGAAFGIFSYLALHAGIVSIGGNQPTAELYLAIAFIAGFSERFVPDLISQVEDVAGGTDASVKVEATAK